MMLEAIRINETDEAKPHASWCELEADGAGGTVNVATIILKSPRCALRCQHCDLWQFASKAPSAPGSIVRQVAFALERLPECQWIKLYNGGNFVDHRSIPTEDHKPLAKLCQSFARVIVENHPRMMRASLRQFADQLNGRLEVAMGLETADSGALKRLNKSMTAADYAKAAALLRSWELDVRTFVVAGLPGASCDIVNDCMHSISFAQSCGSRHVSVIPLRATTRFMRSVDSLGNCPHLSLETLETIMCRAVQRRRSVVTIDLWDIERISRCASCSRRRKQRLAMMNLRQVPLSATSCQRCYV